MASDVRKTRAWRKLRDQVVLEEPVCRLRRFNLGRCTYWSTTGDHIIPYHERPDLALVRSNVQGACANCNNDRGTTPLAALVARADQPEALSIFD